MLSYTKRVLAFIKYGMQPKLTKIPSHKGSVSDLFIWRNNASWKTFFDLIDLNYILDPSGARNSTAIFCFYSSNGKFLGQHLHKFDCSPFERINLSYLLVDYQDEFGTFTVSHNSDVAYGGKFGSLISDRGYVSYSYGNQDFRNYVHGNLDAISYKPNGNPEMLMGSGILRKSFNLQYVFDSKLKYELVCVNATNTQQRIKFTLLSSGFIKEYSADIVVSPLGLGFLKLPENIVSVERYRVSIDSCLAMARPVVFQLSNNAINVFHG